MRLIFFVFILLCFKFITAQEGQIELSPEQKQQFIDAHNRWRSEVGVPPLEWNEELETYAADWAIKQGKKNCKMKHRKDSEYGENLFWTTAKTFTPKEVVDDWGSEIKDYHGEVFGRSKGVVGHYTQIIWRSTTEVGCAAYKCKNAILVVCNYNPPGNWIGEHPYKK